LQDLIAADVFQRLKNAAGPANLDGLGDGFGAQSEMEAFVAGGQVTAAVETVANCEPLAVTSLTAAPMASRLVWWPTSFNKSQ